MVWTASAKSFLFLGCTVLLFSSFEIPLAAQTPAVETIAAELRAGKTAQAMHDADRAIRLHARDPRLWTLKGVAAKTLGENETALAAFTSALRLSPDYLPALEGAAELAYQMKRPQARALVERLLLALPQDPTANGMAAMLDYREERWADAAVRFERSAPAIADQQGAQQAHAATLLHLHRNPEALAVLRSVVERWPDDRHSRYTLAVLQFQEHQPADALKTLQPLLDANDNAALSLAAAISEDQGDTPKAVELLRTAIQQAPTVERNYIDLAAISFDHSSSSAGIAILNAGLTQLPNSASLHVARGILYMQTSNVADAEKDFEIANRLDPSQSFGLEAQGLTAMQRHNLPEALAKVQQSLKANPQSAYLNYLAAEIMKEQGAAPHTPQAEQARAYGRRAVMLDGQLIAAQNLLSSLDFEAGDLGLADKECRAILQQDPQNQEALFRLILVLRRSGDPGKEIPGLVEKLKQLRAAEHNSHVKTDKYRLTEEPPTP